MALPKYQFSIEGVIITNPEGWKDFEITIQRDAEVPGLLVTSTNQFTFKGDGYSILKERFDANYNDKVNVLIEILQADETYLEQYKGVVILTDVSFNLEKFTAETTIEDASFQGVIQNNKNIQSFIDSGITKNGEQLTALPTFQLDYFQSNGSYAPVQERTHFRLKDALDFIVRFMTDDEVKGIQSAYLDDVNNWENSLPYIIMGEQIRTGSSISPNVSFSELITFLQRTHDLSFDFVTDANGNPVMRIEEKEFFFNTTVTDTIRDIKDLTVRIDSQRIASHLNIGNNTTVESGNCSATTRFFSFQKEDYSLRGKGNIDKLLDLTVDFITDSNVIEDIVNNNNDSFDGDVFIVLGVSAANQVTRFQTPAFCSNNFFYNQGFLNSRIVDRQLHSIPNSVTKYLIASTTPSFSNINATFNTVIGISNSVGIDASVINFPDEQYDLGNNYNTSDPNETFYDIPFVGDFSFEVGANINYFIDVGAPTPLVNFATIQSRLEIRRFDSSFTTLKESVDTLSALVLQGQVNDFVSASPTVAVTMACDTGDRIVVRIATLITVISFITQVRLQVVKNSGTFFKCLGSADDAGTFKVFDPNDFRSKLYTFQKSVPLSLSDKIRLNTRDSLIINELSDTTLDKQVWIEEMVNNIETGETSFTMIR